MRGKRPGKCDHAEKRIVNVLEMRCLRVMVGVTSSLT